MSTNKKKERKKGGPEKKGQKKEHERNILSQDSADRYSLQV